MLLTDLYLTLYLHVVFNNSRFQFKCSRFFLFHRKNWSTRSMLSASVLCLGGVSQLSDSPMQKFEVMETSKLAFLFKQLNELF